MQKPAWSAPVAALAAILAVGCSSNVPVPATTVDTSHLEQVEADLGEDLFYVPAEVGFADTLSGSDTIRTNPSLSFMGGGDHFEFPVKQALREACEIAVRSSFQPVTQPPKEIYRSHALLVLFSLRKVVIEHEGGEGRARCDMELGCDVRRPDGRSVIKFPLQLEGIEGQLAEDGTGLNGPGVLWIAAGEVARGYAEKLRSPELRNQFLPEDRFIAWIDNVDGHVAPQEQRPIYSLVHTWGRYIPVVRLY